MNRNAKRTVFSALASVAMAGSLIGLTSTGAFAIDQVPCDAPDYTKITFHYFDSPVGGDIQQCYANGGEIPISTDDPNLHGWLSGIDTGNNHVQWFGDGRWQPDQPIPPYTHMSWPNNPGGVDVQKIRIV